MKKLLAICLALAVVAAAANTASAAAPKSIKNSTLASMGLGGMQPLSDDAGMAVRGKGFASVWGSGFAKVPGAGGSHNGYEAKSHSWGALAVGANLSGNVSTPGFSVSFGASVGYAK